MRLPSLLHLERYVNQGTRTYSRHAGYTEAEDRYRPDAAFDGFDLPAFQIPRDRMIVYAANPPPALASAYLGDERILLCVHPQVLEKCPDDPYLRQALSLSSERKTISVVPSSSTRTLYVENPAHPHAVKVHFPFRISRYTRKMRDEVLEQAINVSRELEEGVELLDDRFAFLREVIGVAHRDLNPDSPRGENWGYLVRDMVPFPRIAADRPLVPGFSLYGKNFFDPDAPILLFDLMGSRDPLAWILENIMLPIVRHWVGCFLHFGYLLEPHGQNVLLELDGDNTVRRIVHRDLSVGIDMRRRRDTGLPDNRLNHYNRMEDGAFHSIAYDRFMGTHFFDRLVEACRESYPEISAEEFRRPCREQFAQMLPDHAKYLPKTIWYFSETRDRFNKPGYRDTGTAPKWRP